MIVASSRNLTVATSRGFLPTLCRFTLATAGLNTVGELRETSDKILLSSYDLEKFCKHTFRGPWGSLKPWRPAALRIIAPASCRRFQIAAAACQMKRKVAMKSRIWYELVLALPPQPAQPAEPARRPEATKRRRHKDLRCDRRGLLVVVFLLTRSTTAPDNFCLCRPRSGIV